MTLISTTHGAYREESDDEMYHLVHAGVGKDPCSRRQALGTAVRSIGPEPQNRRLISKPCFGSNWQPIVPINPLTAMLRCSNGALPTTP
jgi:ketopantoate reductase